MIWEPCERPVPSRKSTRKVELPDWFARAKGYSIAQVRRAAGQLYVCIERTGKVRHWGRYGGPSAPTTTDWGLSAGQSQWYRVTE